MPGWPAEEFATAVIRNMGCCCSREDHDEYEKLVDDEPAPSPAKPLRQPNPRFASVAENWAKDIEDIFNRSPTELPIATDIPRLVKKTKIVLSGMQSLCCAICGNASRQDAHALCRVVSSFSFGLTPRFFSLFLSFRTVPSDGQELLSETDDDSDVIPMIKRHFCTSSSVLCAAALKKRRKTDTFVGRRCPGRWA
jgi:hypothetical protein